MKNIIFGFGLALITLDLSAQTPTVRLSFDKTSMSKAGGGQTVTIVLKPTGTASYQADYEGTFAGKGDAKTVVGGMDKVQQTIN